MKHKCGRKPKPSKRVYLSHTRFDKENHKFMQNVCKMGRFSKSELLNLELERVRMNFTPKEYTNLLAEKRNTISKKSTSRSRHA